MGGKSKLTWLLAVMPLVACSTPEFRPRMVGTPVGVRNSEELLAEGRMQFRNGNFALAVNAFRRAMRDAPQSVEALNGLAASYDRLGRFDLAERYYQEALAIDPTDHRVLHNYAVSLRLQGRERDAEQMRLAAAQALTARPTAEQAALDEVARAAAADALPAHPSALSSAASLVPAATPEPSPLPAAPLDQPVVAPSAEPVATPMRLAAVSAAPVAAGPAPIATALTALPRLAEAPVRSWSIDLLPPPEESRTEPTAAARDGEPPVAPLVLAASSAAPVSAGPAAVAAVSSVTPTSPAASTRSWTIELPPTEVAPAPAAPASAPLSMASAAPVAAGPPAVATLRSVSPPPPLLALNSPPLPKAAPLRADPPPVAAVVAAAPPPVAPSRRTVPLAPAPETPVMRDPPHRAVPRLERISTGEVVLITRDANGRSGADGFHSLRPTVPPRTLVASMMGDVARQVPRAQAAATGQPTRILNAVGRRGQAGRMERHLRSLGWASLTVGDARLRRAASIIIAPPASAEAERLAEELPFRPRIVRRAGARQVLLVLGRDAVPFDRELLERRRS